MSGPGEREQLTTFRVGGELFGIEVMKVQEVTNTPLVVAVPLAPSFLKGLVNLRGQIATAVGLRELFGQDTARSGEDMSVVCKVDGNLVSLIVDDIGDVVELEAASFEPAPHTIPAQTRRYVKGIYKMNGALLSVLNLDELGRELSPPAENINPRNG
jgi:purine-binding chemotaxis protein CheW